MKKIFNIFCLLSLFIAKVDAQTLQDVPVDSLFSKLKNAFDLTQKNQVAEALSVTNEILEFGKQKSNDSLIAYCHNVLGATYSTINSDTLALKHFNLSKSIYEKLHDTVRVMVSNNNIGVIFRHLKQYDKAINHFNQASMIADNLDAYTQSVFTNYNIGYTKLESGADPNEALQYLLKSETFIAKSKPEDVKRIKADILEAFGESYLKLKEYELAEEKLNLAIEYSSKNNFYKVLDAAYELKARLYKELGEFEKASEMLNALMSVKDSIVKIEKFNVVKDIEAKYAAKENYKKLKYIEKEKSIQEATIKKARSFNILLLLFSVVLLFTGYWIIIKNKQLKQAKEKAENLSKAKSEFYSEISHELRTPLYAVIELSSILLKENQNKEHHTYLESLKFSGNHLLSLINNVLELNKMESGMMRLQQQDFDLRLLIKNIIDSLEYALRDSNNSIQLHYDNSIPHILKGDSLKLSQILINLIANATKFTKNGTVKVDVALLEVTNENVVLKFKVEDDGPGISKKNQQKIFESFYQDSSSNDTKFKGTGLGLSIVKRMLNIMDSDIKIESELGKGSVFAFQLKLQKTHKKNNPIELYSTTLKDINNINILVVDDNKINQMVTKKVLDQLNLKSQSIDNGADTIKMVKTNDYDCILMDLHMPEMDGYQTTQAIRKFNQEIPIVALTSASSIEIKDKIYKYEMDGYILKPFIVSDFIQVLKKAIKKRKSLSA